MVYLEPCIFLAYSEPCHIQNPGIFRTSDILRAMSRHSLAYSERCVTLSKNFAIFMILAFWHLGPEAYSEFCLFRHIPAYNYDSYNKLNFLIVNTFQRNLRTHMFFNYNDVNFNGRVSLFN